MLFDSNLLQYVHFLAYSCVTASYVEYQFIMRSSLSIRLFLGGGEREGEERKGKREEKPDTEALRRVFRPLEEHDASP